MVQDAARYAHWEDPDVAVAGINEIWAIPIDFGRLGCNQRRQPPGEERLEAAGVNHPGRGR